MPLAHTVLFCEHREVCWFEPKGPVLFYEPRNALNPETLKPEPLKP